MLRVYIFQHCPTLGEFVSGNHVIDFIISTDTFFWKVRPIFQLSPQRPCTCKGFPDDVSWLYPLPVPSSQRYAVRMRHRCICCIVLRYNQPPCESQGCSQDMGDHLSETCLFRVYEYNRNAAEFRTFQSDFMRPCTSTAYSFPIGGVLDVAELCRSDSKQKRDENEDFRGPAAATVGCSWDSGNRSQESYHKNAQGISNKRRQSFPKSNPTNPIP